MAAYLLTLKLPLDEAGADRLRAKYPSHFQLAPTVWMLASDAPNETAASISQSLFPPYEPGAPAPGAAFVHVVFPVTTYWGYNDPALWEWLGRHTRTARG